jgi:hypothetical protein
MLLDLCSGFQDNVNGVPVNFQKNSFFFHWVLLHKHCFNESPQPFLMDCAPGLIT